MFPPFPPPPITGRCSYSSLAGRPLDKLHNGANGLWNFDSYILKFLQNYTVLVNDCPIQILLRLTIDDTIKSTQGLRTTTTGRSGGEQVDYVIQHPGTQALKRGSAAQSSLSYFQHSKQTASLARIFSLIADPLFCHFAIWLRVDLRNSHSFARLHPFFSHGVGSH